MHTQGPRLTERNVPASSPRATSSWGRAGGERGRRGCGEVSPSELGRVAVAPLRPVVGRSVPQGAASGPRPRAAKAGISVMRQKLPRQTMASGDCFAPLLFPDPGWNGALRAARLGLVPGLEALATDARKKTRHIDETR